MSIFDWRSASTEECLRHITTPESFCLCIAVKVTCYFILLNIVITDRSPHSLDWLSREAENLSVDFQIIYCGVIFKLENKSRVSALLLHFVYNRSYFRFSHVSLLVANESIKLVIERVKANFLETKSKRSFNCDWSRQTVCLLSLRFQVASDWIGEHTIDLSGSNQSVHGFLTRTVKHTVSLFLFISFDEEILFCPCTYHVTELEPVPTKFMKYHALNIAWVDLWPPPRANGKQISFIF